METAIFNPINKTHRSEIGGAKKFQPQRFTLLVKKDVETVGVHFCVTKEDRPTYKVYMEKVGEKNGYNVFEVTFTFIESGIYNYYFSFWNGEKTVFVGKGIIGIAEMMDFPLPWQLTCYEEGETPSNFKGKIIYQIFPDRFNKAGEIFVREGGFFHENWESEPYYLPVNGKILNDDFFGGNFEGIIAKLDYLKTLDVGYIYLNPIFEAESNHKYDTSDFSVIDKAFGGEEKFLKLVNECKTRNIGIILDGVFNHVGMNSKYFNRARKYEEDGAYNSVNSKYHDWFTFKKFPDDYLCWWGIELLPAINENAKSFAEYICGEDGIVEKYLKMGVAGFRLDVVDELPDEFLDMLVRKIKSVNKDAIIIGEVWEDASNKVAYGKRRKYFTSNQLDGVMNYPWKNAIIEFVKTKNSKPLYTEIMELVNNYPKKNLHALMNILGTHDTQRILTALGGEPRAGRTRQEIANVKMSKNELQKAVQMLMTASILQFTLPGVPSIYYGDEVGMDGYEDPFNRRTFPWGRENTTLLSHYLKLTKLRKEECFAKGEIVLDEYREGVISFSRISENSEVKVIVNLSDKPILIGREQYDFLTEDKILEVKQGTCGILKIR